MTKLGIWGHVTLTIGKIGAGVMGNSAVLVADGAHSFGDLVSDFITLQCLKVSATAPDEKHPYGHGKYESLGALSISTLLVSTGLATTYHSFLKIQAILTSDVAMAPGTPSSLALSAAVVSLIMKEGLFRITMRVAKRSGNTGWSFCLLCYGSLQGQESCIEKI